MSSPTEPAIRAVDEQNTTETPASVDLRDKLHSAGKLVKRWRLPAGRERRHWDRENEARVKGPKGSMLYGQTFTAGVYLDPGTGRFYGRVPEQEDGALYVADNRDELLKQLREALEASVAANLPPDTRTWERRIRVSYPQPKTFIGKWNTGENDRIPHNLHEHPARLAGHLPLDLRADKASDMVGPLTFTRVERAPRPGSGWDVREWAEDYAVRLDRWRERPMVSVEPTIPERWETVERKGHGDEGLMNWQKPWRDLAWDAQLWDALHNFQARIRELDTLLRAYVVEAGVADFTERVLSMSALPALTVLED